jgi:hypothetical protein
MDGLLSTIQTLESPTTCTYALLNNLFRRLFSQAELTFYPSFDRNTRAANPTAVWEDPRPAYYASYDSLANEPPKQQHYAPPPPQQQQSYQQQSGQNSPYQQQQQQGQGQAADYYGNGASNGQPPVGAVAQSDADKGLFSKLTGHGNNQQQYQQQQYGQQQCMSSSHCPLYPVLTSPTFPPLLPDQQPQQSSSSGFNSSSLLAGSSPPLFFHLLCFTHWLCCFPFPFFSPLGAGGLAAGGMAVKLFQTLSGSGRHNSYGGGGGGMFSGGGGGAFSFLSFPSFLYFLSFLY